MTTRYVPLCSVPGCPAASDDSWHRCFACGKQPIQHQHWPKLSQAGKASRIVAALCPAHHDKIDNGLWTNGIHQEGNKWFYWVLDEHGKTVMLWTPEGRVNQREIADPQFPGSIPVKRIPTGEPIEPRGRPEPDEGAFAALGEAHKDWMANPQEEEEPDPDEGLELRPEIEERLRQSQFAGGEAAGLIPQEASALPAVPSAREQLAKASNKGRQALELASSVAEVKDIRDRAEALGAYAKAAHLGLQAQNEMADIKIRAERKAGQLLSTIEREPGKKGPTSLQAAIRLADIGSTMAHRWQLEAEISDLEYEAYAQTCNQEDVELTSAGVLRLVRALLRQDEPPAAPDVCSDCGGSEWEQVCKRCGKERGTG